VAGNKNFLKEKTEVDDRHKAISCDCHGKEASSLDKTKKAG
jgi:hypothetical protein